MLFNTKKSRMYVNENVYLIKLIKKKEKRKWKM